MTAVTFVSSHKWRHLIRLGNSKSRRRQFDANTKNEIFLQHHQSSSSWPPARRSLVSSTPPPLSGPLYRYEGDSQPWGSILFIKGSVKFNENVWGPGSLIRFLRHKILQTWLHWSVSLGFNDHFHNKNKNIIDEKSILTCKPNFFKSGHIEYYIRTPTLNFFAELLLQITTFSHQSFHFLFPHTHIGLLVLPPSIYFSPKLHTAPFGHQIVQTFASSVSNIPASQK